MYRKKVDDRRTANINKYIQKYCTTHNIECTEALLNNYKQWSSDPANKSKVTYSYTFINYDLTTKTSVFNHA